MSDTPKRDFISYLPYELLSDISNRAYKDTPPPRTPISRAFLPFQRRALFRRVKISSSAQFESLIEAYEGNSRLGGIVKVIEVDNVDEKSKSVELAVNEALSSSLAQLVLSRLRESFSPPRKISLKATKNVRRVKSFFATLVNLEHLKLGANCPSVVDLVLSLRIARSELPRLDTLEIAYSANAKKPFDSKVYCHLDAYPCLRRLEISAPQARSFACSARGGRPVAKIQQLALSGWAVHGSATCSFVQNFPNLTSLSLDTLDSPLADYRILVKLLPTSLTSLSLFTQSFPDEYSKPCDAWFPRLVNIEHLSRAGNLLPEPHRLSPPSREPQNPRIWSKSRLIFDQIEGKIGWQIEKDSDGITLHPDFASNPWHLGPGWIIPKWAGLEESAPTETDMVILVKDIRAKGIKVEGKTLEAFGVFEEWRYETMYGDEMVDEMLYDGIDDGWCSVCGGYH
ncbi:hypothetical protein JCM16303_002740 [Sporobolomyces ruberrimus]